jgi:hypothetical protein
LIGSIISLFARPGFVCIPLVLAVVTATATAQSVLLQIRPHAGDTLHLRLDQEMDISGTSQQAPGDPPATVTTTWFVLQRMVVERVDSSGADVLQVTDSVSTVTAGARGSTAVPRARSTIDGTQVHLHIAADGAVKLRDSTDHVSSALREVLTDLPVTFPRDPIKVGHSWVRTMKLPASATYPNGNEIKLGFRLDSVSQGGDSAYVSVHGPLGKPRADAVVGGATVTMRGTLVGTMLIDRRRGWLTDWHAIIDVQYVMRPPRGSDATPGRMRMTATQWLRAVDRP